ALPGKFIEESAVMSELLALEAVDAFNESLHGKYRLRPIQLTALGDPAGITAFFGHSSDITTEEARVNTRMPSDTNVSIFHAVWASSILTPAIWDGRNQLRGSPVSNGGQNKWASLSFRWLNFGSLHAMLL
ncbi:MAG: hypothetical protein L0Z50_19620, partial [Verrucomicrobiales bacterium]|nr:hypothetical protein [Verrucomicrobiales bacterium]